MLVTKKRRPPQPCTLSIKGKPLECVKQFKYLGILLTDNLSWSPHIESICMKSNKIIGLLYRKFYNTATNSTLLELYKTMVRPHLEYATQVWSPHLIKDISRIEKVQKFAIRMCLHKWDMNYENLLEEANLPTLKDRRLYLNLCTLFKIIHNLISLPNTLTQSTRNNLPLYRVPFARTTAYQTSFFPSTISVWNNLPSETLQALSLTDFKRQLKLLLL